MMLPGRTGPVSYYGDPNQNATESGLSSGVNAGLAGGVGALAGGAYHLAKRKLLNTPEENAQEDAEGGYGLKRVLAPAAAMAGINFVDRQVFPRNINNPEMNMFPKGAPHGS